MGVARWAVLWAALILLPCMPALAQVDDDGGPTQGQYQGDGCTPITTLSGNTAKRTEPFGVGTTTLRIVYETQPANNRGFNSTDIAVVDETVDAGGTQIDSVEAVEGEDGVLEVPLEVRRYSVQAETFEQSYDIVVEARGGDEPCTPAPVDDDPNIGDGVDVDDPDDVVPGTGDDKPLPKTGGVPLLFAAASLVLAAALVVRRTLVA